MNWKKEAAEKLGRYEAMQLAVENLPGEIARLELEATAIRSSSMKPVFTSGTVARREDALLNNIVQRQELTLALKQAQLSTQTTERALKALNPQQHAILHRLYICPQPGGIEQLCRELGLEQSSIYRRRDDALRKFTIACYGAE